MIKIFSISKKNKIKHKVNKDNKELSINNKIACSVKEFAIYMGCSYNKAIQLTNAEGFPVIKVGNTKLVILKEVDEWLKKHIGDEF